MMGGLRTNEKKMDCDGEIGELFVDYDPDAIPLRVLCNKVMDFLLENNEIIIKGEIETE